MRHKCFRLTIVTFMLFALAAGWAVAGNAAADPDRPRLTLESSDAGTRIWVEAVTADGGIARTLLRTTEASVAAGPTGTDPARRAAFVAWDESGSGRWISYSRDAGASWSDPSRLDRELLLRAGAVSPSATMPAVPDGLAAPAASGVYLVQFRTKSLPEWRAALSNSGVEILAAFPRHAHIVRIEPGLVASVRALDFVERIEPYHPAYRIEPAIVAWMQSDATPPGATEHVRVMSFTWGPEGKERIAGAARAAGAEVVAVPPSGHILELRATPAQLRAIAAHDDVMWIDRWSAPETDMDLVREDAGTNWLEDNFGYCGQGVRGEVLDSGIEADHMDFDGVILHGGNSTSSHGTSTFGIVFGNGDRDGDGEAKGTGHMPCPEAQGIFADYDFLDDRFAHTQELKEEPYFASFQTNSWGDARTRSYTSVSHEMDDIIWRLDIAILQSQSNAGNQDSRPQAWAKNIISVGGVYHNDTLDTSDDEWNSGASIGPAEDGRIKPDIHYWYDDIYTTTTGNGYTAGFGGTSGATPESAGVLGLMLQMWSENAWETDPEGSTVFERQPHFSTLKALLLNNAQQYPFSGEEDDLTRVHQGWGRPSVRVAKERAANSFIVDEEVVLELGDFQVFDVDVAAGEAELKVTMVYPDPPGTTSATLHRINDLDLKVTSPSGTIYHGNWGLKANNYSQSGGVPNELDTVENVFIENPEPGVWQVEIAAAEINQDAYLDTAVDDATFALVVTGGTSELIQPSAGRVRLDKDAYGCEDRVGIRVIDGNVGAPSVTVTIWSDSEPVGETLTLAETRPDSGKYAGEIDTSGQPPVTGDGLLSVSNGDTITVEYIDADDGEGGTNLPRNDTSTVDCQKPVITGVGEESVSDVSATIVWTTDELASSEVIWGDSVPPTLSEEGFGRTTDHAIGLDGLQECTVYYYEVRSADRHGNLAVDDNGGTYHYFETLGDFGQGLQPCHAGQVRIDQDVVSCSDTLSFNVVDLDLNPSPDVVDTATLWVTSSTESTAEGVVVTETGPNTSKFTGSIATAAGTPTPDGILQVSDNDTVTVTYRDADDGTGTPAVSFDTAMADCSGPAISDLATSAITDARVTVQWKTDEPADTVVQWGATPALGEVITVSESVTSHAVTLNQGTMCAPLYVRVSSTDAHGNTASADAGGAAHEVLTWNIPGLYWHERFEDGATGWSLEGEWEVGQPQGLGGSSGLPDPAAAYNNAGVLGNDLTGLGAFPGDYEPSIDESATTPTFDASTWTDTKLIIHRRLNVDDSDEASIWLWSGAGRPLYRSESTVSQSAFSVETWDLGQLIDGVPQFYLEFRLSSDADTQRSGWNVDDVILKDGALPDYAACGGCSHAPSFAGAASAVDENPCGQDGVTVSWTPAFSWGSGGAGTYAVYRGETPDFTPGPANLVASGVDGLSWFDASAPEGGALYYVVRAENDESCSNGPAGGGMLDDNLVYASVSNTLDRPLPGSIDSLAVDLVGSVHVRLNWAAPQDAAYYNVYRSLEPTPGSFAFFGDTHDTVFDDEGSGANANSYFYLVRAANACGQETP